MAYVKIEGGVVVQRQTKPGHRFAKAPDWVVCGMQFDGEKFVLPPAADKTPVQKRDDSLNALAYDLGGGRIIQVRPKDEQNIRNALEIMARKGLTERLWRMLDNTAATVTASELTTALHYGQDQADAIWAIYLSEA